MPQLACELDAPGRQAAIGDEQTTSGAAGRQPQAGVDRHGSTDACVARSSTSGGREGCGPMRAVQALGF